MKADKNIYIHTIGCQMNVYDSERIAAGLKSVGYTPTHSPDNADMIVLNTCAIREKAEQKVFSFLGRLLNLKRKNPDLIIGVGGCVAQQEGKKILSRVPFVDVIFGTNAIDRLPSIVEKIESKKQKKIIDIEFSDIIDEIVPAEQMEQSVKPSRFVTIMQGCDNFCAYCVVPHVRGREKSRDPEKIAGEIEKLVESGVREVTLLGQNVNSYGKKEGLCSFAELLSKINGIDGLSRIRFTTSHPKDLPRELIDAFGSLEKLCGHIHLPVQSGSNHVLKKMNRKYTRELYLEKIEELRKVSPDIAITSDFIVGFPGETPEDFEETISLIQSVKYDGLFAFKYSDRPNAPARNFSEKIPEDVKKARLKILLDMQDGITVEKNLSLVGSVRQILVDGHSKRERGNGPGPDGREQWTGRTTTNKIVNFHKPDGVFSGTIVPGGLIDVQIEKAYTHSVWGRYAGDGPPVSKGENDYAA